MREQLCGVGDELLELRVSTSVCTGQCAWAPNVNISIRGSVRRRTHTLQSLQSVSSNVTARASVR